METSNEKAELTTLFENLSAAWNKGDGTLFSHYFTEDCDYVTFQGDHLKGRPAVAHAHQQLLNGILRGSRLVGKVKAVRLLTPEVAILHGKGAVQLRWQKKVPRSRQSINTNVIVKQNGEWKIAAFHNCRVQSPGLLQRWWMWFNT